MLLDIHLLFPRLVASSSSPQTFKGYVNIAGKDLYLCLTAPFFPKSKGLHIGGDFKLLEMLQTHRIGPKEDDDEETVLEVLEQLNKLNELQETESSLQNKIFDHHTSFSTYLCHLESIGWKSVLHVSPDFSKTVLQSSDRKDRIHKLTVKFPSLNSFENPIIEAELPLHVDFRWKTDELLVSTYKIWNDHIEKLQLFWDVMDDIDSTAFVLDPPAPTRKHTTRRILLENQVSAQLTISPEHPLARPQCQFFGPSSLVLPLDEKIIENFEAWNPENGTIQGLEQLIGVAIVRKSCEAGSPVLANSFGALDFECTVCYSLHLNEQLPDFVCDHCQKKFHLECLYDWLRSLPNSKLSVSFICGECPFCTKDISCQAPR